MANFISYDRSQGLLLPPDLRDWIGDDDFVHFICGAVERVDISAFKVNCRGHSKAQYHPRMMLALLIYCYANGIFSSRRIERAQALRKKLVEDIAVLTARAEAADVEESEDPQALPAEIARREVLKAKLDEACARLEADARAQAADKQPEHEEKIAAWEARNRRGRKPAPPDDTPPPNRQGNLTDPNSKLMRKSKCHEFRQAYNAQAVVDADGSQLVLTTNVAQTPSDGPTFEETIIQLCEEVGQPETVLGDAGFASGDAVANLEGRGIEVLVAVSRPDNERTTSDRPSPTPSRHRNQKQSGGSR